MDDARAEGKPGKVREINPEEPNSKECARAKAHLAQTARGAARKGQGSALDRADLPGAAIRSISSIELQKGHTLVHFQPRSRDPGPEINCNTQTTHTKKKAAVVEGRNDLVPIQLKRHARSNGIMRE
jgi:hypothetical protein